MRKSAKLLANFLGATKELTSEYVSLADITEDEQNQIAHTVMSRPDRRATAKMLAAKGLSTRQIADVTGWDHSTIANDLRAMKAVEKSTAIVEKSTRTTTTDHAAKEERAARVSEAAEAEGVTKDPARKYRIIYADPPWSYGNTMPDGTTEPRDHYPVMELKAICALPVKEWIESDAVLFLWATSPILLESFDVIREWGFEYKASFVWDKIKHNMGHYNSVRHEFLLICTRSSCQPDKMQLFDSVQSIERGKHSHKPVEFIIRGGQYPIQTWEICLHLDLARPALASIRRVPARSPATPHRRPVEIIRWRSPVRRSFT
jgi:N6-adenosine-specific RNA methylase IME4